MKKYLLMTVSCLLAFCLCTTALANSWGLRGGIYDIVSDDKRYEDYSAAADDGNKRQDGVHVNHAVLQNRYHAVLIAAARAGKTWEAEAVSTIAVYQPGALPADFPRYPTLTHQDSGFILSYGDREGYTFLRDEDGQYLLYRAEFRDENGRVHSLHHQPEGMLLWQSGPGDTFASVGDAMWETQMITLAEFNIAQTPRTIREVCNIRKVSAVLWGDTMELTASAFTRKGDRNGRTLPVYSAPDKNAYRSGSGKASVSLRGDVTVYGVSDGWTLISYEVSPRTSRFGYIEGDYASGAEIPMRRVKLVAAADTFLTDDPFVSQYAQVRIEKGAALTGLIRCGEYYAYCELVQGDVLYRGFVPMKDLTTLYDHGMSLWSEIEDGTAPLMADVRWDVMDTLVGKWESSDDEGRGRLILFAGGDYRNHMPGDGAWYRESGTFRVYDRADGSYELMISLEGIPLDAPPTVTKERSYTMTLNTDGTITLTDEKGVSTLYRRDEYSTYGNG